METVPLMANGVRAAESAVGSVKAIGYQWKGEAAPYGECPNRVFAQGCPALC